MGPIFLGVERDIYSIVRCCLIRERRRFFVFFCFFLSRGLCFSWTKAFVKSFITVAALNRTTLEKKWEQILAGGMLFLKTELQRQGIFKVRISTGLFTTSRGLQQCRAPHSWISHWSPWKTKAIFVNSTSPQDTSITWKTGAFIHDSFNQDTDLKDVLQMAKTTLSYEWVYIFEPQGNKCQFYKAGVHWGILRESV